MDVSIPADAERSNTSVCRSWCCLGKVMAMPHSLQTLQILRAQLDAWVAGSGQQLVQALIYAALDTCPRQLLRMLAAPLRALLDDRAYGTAAVGWLSHALTIPDMPGMTSWCYQPHEGGMLQVFLVSDN